MSKNPVLLSLGGNLGDVSAAFEHAIGKLKQNGFELLKRSSIFHSKAMGCEENAPDFLNCSILGNWNGTPEELLELIHKTEVEAGRPADHPHWVSRPLDIDIILMGDTILQTETLTIPHFELTKRDFVLIPSAEIAPDMLIPTLFKTFSDLTIAGE